jgi:uncharacterized membrane protein (UPF0127 family)
VAESIVVEPSGRILADRVPWARTPAERVRGLVGSAPLESGEALVITRGYQVHTFFMSYPIDVVFCDGAWNVRRVVAAMPPRRITGWVRRSRFVIELPAGAAGDDVRPGVRLIVDG